jgi:hypothetical protein
MQGSSDVMVITGFPADLGLNISDRDFGCDANHLSGAAAFEICSPRLLTGLFQSHTIITVTFTPRTVPGRPAEVGYKYGDIFQRSLGRVLQGLTK